MNNKTKFELSQCVKELRDCHEILNSFSSKLNKSLVSLEESALSSEPNLVFVNPTDKYGQVITTYRKLAIELVDLSNTIDTIINVDLIQK